MVLFCLLSTVNLARSQSSAGTALRFDGVNDLVTFGTVSPLSAHTIEAWVKPEQTATGIIVGQLAGPAQACSLGMYLGMGGDGAGYVVDVAGCGSAPAIFGPVLLGVWTHLAGTYDGNSIMKFYVNGVLVGERGNVPFNASNFMSAGAAVFFNGPQQFYLGELDEVRIWNRARTSEEINGAMRRSLSGAELGLVGYWKFDEGSGQDVADSSPSAVTGVLGTNSTSQTSDPMWVSSSAPVGGFGQGVVLTVGPRVLDFSATVGDPPARQSLQIGSNAGTVNWTTTVRLLNGSDWLTVSPTSGTSTLTQSAITIVEVNYGALGSAGVFQAVITITDTATGLSVAVPVTAVLSTPGGRLLLSPTAVVFKAQEGGSIPPPKAVTIVNKGQGSLSWSIPADLAAPLNWLTVSALSGTAGSGPVGASTTTVTANPAGLAAGVYQVLAPVSAPGASNDPQLFSVTLHVVPPATQASADIAPHGLVFVAPETGAGAPDQELVVSNGGGGTLTFQLTPSGGNWLMVSPASGSTAAGPVTVQVSVDPTGLLPGKYRGKITGTFSAGAPQEVNVVLIVTSEGKALQGAGSSTAACTAQEMELVATTIGNGLSLPVSFPRVLTALVVDDCGSGVDDATLVASVEGLNIPLRSLGTGFYSGTWVPQSEAAEVTLTFDALHPDFAQVQQSFAVSTAAAPGDVSLPTLFADGVVEGAGFTPRRPLSPGGIISLFGARFAGENNFASQLPLERELAGVSVRVGDQDAPLFFVGPGQINAQMPFEVSLGDSVPVAVSVGGLLTAPQNYLIAPTQPGVFIAGENAAILDASFHLVTPQNPARPGDTIQIFCTGLGTVEQQVETGAPAPSFSTVQLPVTVTIGGINAPVDFQGLAPGFVGLYQVNAVVPAGVEPGDAIPLVLTQNGIVANPDLPVTIPIQAP